MSKTWLITGATRGMGTDFAKSAVAAGHNVVATGRKVEVLNEALGSAENLLTLSMDVNDVEAVKVAVDAAKDRFGRIDVLLNNAANFYAGYFEELTPDEIHKQLETTLFGAMGVTRAVLPVMRAQRSGHVVTISSTAGLVGYEFTSAYSAAKFAVEGWMESLQPEVESYGISTTIVNPGFFRTELLGKESTRYAEATIDDYAERTHAQQAAWTSQNGKQGGDPAKLAQALLKIVAEEKPPLRFIAGNDALAEAERKIATLQKQIEAHRELSSSLAIDSESEGQNSGSPLPSGGEGTGGEGSGSQGRGVDEPTSDGTAFLLDAPKANRGNHMKNHQATFAKTALTAIALFVAPLSWSQANAPASKFDGRTYKTVVSGPNVKHVWFKNGPIEMAGNVYLPTGFDGRRKYPAIVVVHPNGGIKEQTAGLYAQRMSEQGFVTLAFDASYQGESGGMPRLLDSPRARVGDVRAAVDYLTTIPYVDADRLGAIGMCAGSGFTIKAVTLERRIKAVATISAVDVGAASRKGWDGKSTRSLIPTLEAIAAERTAIAKGAKPTLVEYVPEKFDGNTPRDLREAYDYYRLPIAYEHPRSPNRFLLMGQDETIGFTGFDQVDTLLTQPLLVIAGSEAGSLWHSQELYSKAASKDKELFVIDGATHMDLYAGPKVDQALDKLAPFFKRSL